ncbi:MAG: DUF4255 domain-containing protein, partial [Chloroflexota bacterium]
PPQASVGVNLFLYQVALNPYLSNQDLPRRNVSGQIAQQPSTPYDLYYMLTFSGQENDFEAERLLGAVLNGLSLHSVLTRDKIQQAIDANSAGYLQDSDLVNQLDHISLEPMALSVDEMFRLWSSLSSVNYRLSVAYKVSVVILDPEVSISEALSPNT